MLAVFCAAFEINALTLQPPVWYSVVLLGLGALSFAAVPLIMRKTNSVALPGALVCGWLMLLCAMLALRVGATAPALMVFTVMPLLAFFFVGRQGGWIFATLSIAAVLAISAWAPDGLVGDSGYTAGDIQRIRILLICVLIVFVTVMTWLYETSRQTALHQERRARQQLQLSHAELTSARDRAEQANRAKDTFLATVSHEIRTPLHGVVGALELIARDGDAVSQSEHFDVAQRSAVLLQSLVTEVLDLSRIEAGGLELEPVDCDPRVVLAEAVAVHAVAARQKRLQLPVEIAADVPAAVRLDALRFRQVVVNLVGNAIKFTESGRVAITLGVAARDGDNLRLRCEVSDTGIGIERDVLGAIFEPFRQGDSSTTRRYGGSGLGLAICRRLVDLMGGEIGVTSEPEQGARFWFEVNATVAVAPPIFEETPSTDTALVAPARILLVEDNPISQHVTLHLLHSLGHVAQAADSGQAALDAIADNRFDVVLMDCDMPVMDGLEATRRVRAAETEGEHLPIVALTAHGMEEQHRLCLDAGMDHVLAKPVSRRELRAELDRFLITSPETKDLT